MNKIWIITDLKRIKETGRVFYVDYQLTVNIGEELGVFSSTLELAIDENSNEFIPFEDLTEDIVLSWVKNHIGINEVLRIERHTIEYLEEKINRINPSDLIEGMPWNK